MRKSFSLLLVFMILFTSAGNFTFAEGMEDPELTGDETAVNADYDWLRDELILNEQFSYSITDNLYMPDKGPNGCSITWESSNEDLITTDGIVNRPTYFEFIKDYGYVLITATISKGEASRQKSLGVHVMPLPPANEDEEAVIADYDWLTDWIIMNGQMYGSITDDLYMPDEGPNGSSITWESSDEDVIATDGTVNRPLFSETMEEYVYVTIKATISKGEVSLQKTLQLRVIAYPPAIEEEIAIAKAWLTYDVVLNGNRADDVKTDLNLVTETPWYYIEFGYYGDCLVTWESSDPGIIAVDDTVNRPQKNTGYREVTLTATI